MFGKKRSTIRPGRIDSLIGRQTEFVGDVRFGGGLHVDGIIKGNVMAAERHVELTSSARISGDVYYGLIEMAMGAEVNGSLIPRVEGAGAAAHAPVSDETSPLPPPLRATREEEPE